MSALRLPGLGPVVGHTTHNTCHLWIQAGVPTGTMSEHASNQRTVGVLGRLSGDKKKVEKAYYFRLHREFDRTGIFVLGDYVTLGHHKDDEGVEDVHKADRLKSDTEYTVRVATLSLDDPMPDAESLSDVELARQLPPIGNMAPLLMEFDPEGCQATFRTFTNPATTDANLAFLLGSCRYPGLMWKVKEADRVFGPMREHLDHAGAKDFARFTLMVGDQIYADTLNRFLPIGRADTYDEFQERYQEALGSPNMRNMLRTAPVYMILDDHEIEDNWSQDRLTDGGKHRLFNFAIGAYMSYQWSHSPRTHGRLLYYNFACGGYPFFVLDTRTQRFHNDVPGLKDNHLLGRPTIDKAHPGQLKRLLNWLSGRQKQQGNVPKFVASASVFAPNSMGARLCEADPKTPLDLFTTNLEQRELSDSWSAFPTTRRAILDHIVKNKIQNVVFLTGDIHCSNIAELDFETGEGADREPLGLRAYDITSSAFYWPFPFADGDPNNFVHDSRKREQFDVFPIKGGEMHYRAWSFTQEDNFCRVEIDRKNRRLDIRYFDRRGEPLKVTDRTGKAVLVNSLDLEKWE